jgi:transcriptional regulator with PAS, ATPase and Fis domain
MALETYFASAERDSREAVQLQKRQLKEKLFMLKILDSIPTTVMVLNKNRQAVYCNRSLIDYLGLKDDESLVAKRPGEILDCTNSMSAPSGCGTGLFCKYCDAVQAILDCIEGKQSARNAR